MAWPKGKPLPNGKVPGSGRKVGTPNKRQSDAAVFAASILEDPTYLENLRDRVLTGQVSPAMEVLLFHYLYGKPKDYVEHSGDAERPLAILLRRGSDNGHVPD